MKVLIVEPMKPCYVREISGLNDMQEIVGGHIEAIYPFKEQVAIIANEEGKILGLPFNRPLSDERGVPYDIVCGTFFLAGLGAEDFVSLTEEQIRRYKELWARLQEMDKRAIAQFGHNPLGQFTKNWTVEQLERRFANEDRQVSVSIREER